jgi:hypothetical protein
MSTYRYTHSMKYIFIFYVFHVVDVDTFVYKFGQT